MSNQSNFFSFSNVQIHSIVTHPIYDNYVLLSSDHQLRLFDMSTEKLIKTYNSRIIDNGVKCFYCRLESREGLVPVEITFMQPSTNPGLDTLESQYKDPNRMIRSHISFGKSKAANWNSMTWKP